MELDRSSGDDTALRWESLELGHGQAQRCDVSFVVIGYNEGAFLRRCLQTVHHSDTSDFSHEIIYVDGGSTDASLDIARESQIDKIIGGDKRRRAAENRNAGLRGARGEFIQFLDGDMYLDAAWPKVALEYLRQHPEAAALWGILEEERQHVFYRALELDWRSPEGPVPYCGGAAMFRRDVLLEFGGFPEDVAYGEEPYLCWRIRNEGGYEIHHLHHRMVQHNLAYRGFFDYFRRNARVGLAYAEISVRCKGTPEAFWQREMLSNFTWGMVLFFTFLLLPFTPGVVRGLVLFALFALLYRKAYQVHEQGESWAVAATYALHTYLAKIGIAHGILKWHLTERHKVPHPR